MKNYSITYRLTVFIVGFVTLILILLISFQYRTTRRAMMEDVQAEIQSIANNAASTIWEELETIESITANYSAYLLNRYFEYPEQLRTVLRNLVYTDSLIAGASIIVRSEERPMLFEFRRSDDTFYLREDRAYISEKTAPHLSEAWSDPHLDPLYGEYVVSFEQKLYRFENDSLMEVAGIVVDVSLHWINRIINAIDIFDSGEVFLVSGNGTFITHPDPERAGRRNIRDLLEEAGSAQVSAVVESISSGEKGFLEIRADDLFEEDGLITYQPLFDTRWSTVLAFRKTEYMARVNRVTGRMVLIGGISLLILGALIFIIIRRLTTPLVQLTRLTESIRQGQFDIRLPERSSGVEAMQISETIRSLQTELSGYIENLSLTIAEKERIESDIRIASEIQADLIPSSFPDPAAIGGFDIYGKVLPARWVSGDLFDFLEIDEDHLCFMIGDVTGKGVPASLFMAITRTLMRTESRRVIKPARIMEAVNDHLSAQNPSSVFVTAILGVLERSTGMLEYCNAGHLYPVLCQQGGDIMALEKNHGLPLGLYGGKRYLSDTVQLGKGSALILYSDGIIEAENGEGKLFGAERLMEFLNALMPRPPVPEEWVLRLIEEVEKYSAGEPRSDDMTVLMISRN